MQNKPKTLLLTLLSVIIIILVYFLDNYLLKAIPFFRLSFLNPLFTFLGGSSGLIIYILFLALLFLYEKKPKFILYLITAAIIAFILGYLLKYIILRPRPEIIPLLIKTSPAFPSAHALIASSTFFFIKKLKTRYFALTLTFLIAFSGYYNGVHYLSDILAGIFLGIIISYLVLKKIPILFQKSKSQIVKS